MARKPIHPSEFLIDELKEIEVTPTELSRRIGVPPNRISQIVRGKRDITVDTALRLGQFFDTTAELWINLQRDYDLDKVKAESWPEIHKDSSLAA